MDHTSLFGEKISRAMAKFHNHPRYRKYTLEEIEAARQFVARQNSNGDPDCPVCDGIGRVSNGITDIHDPGFGQGQWCICMDPIKIYGGHSGLDEKGYGMAWESIEEIGNVMEAVDAVQEAIGRRYGIVTLFGAYGVAKTMILKTAVAESIRSKRPAGYSRMAEIIDNLRQAFDKTDPSVESQRRLNMWAELPLLCIDEFDRVRDTEFAVERRFVLMDRRYEEAKRGKSITLIASNTDPDKYEGYLADRLMDKAFRVINLTGWSGRRDWIT